MDADKLFQAALFRRALSFERNEQGLYLVQLGEATVSVNLENVRRNFERDQDAEEIERFVEQLDGSMFCDPPGWNDVRPFLRYSLEPSDYAMGFEQILHERITEKMVKVFVYTPADGSRISWVSHDMIAKWCVSKEEVFDSAVENMDQLVRSTRLEVQTVDDAKLGMLAIDEPPFKASLILSTEFRTLVSPELGWPVFVVAPTRDFVYVLAQRDRGFLGRLGKVVMREYTESGHPITPEVLEVGDDGVVAIGSFGKGS